MANTSNLERLLTEGHFVVCGEMSPPQGADKAAILKKCGNFKDVVDAVNLTDNQTAIVRISSVMSSVFALEGGVEPIMQMTCRDRNRLAQQSDILGAYAAGVSNILCLTGDYQSFGNHPGAKGVFDLDSIQLIHTTAEMNQGLFISGEEIKPPPRMFIGGAANPFAEPLICESSVWARRSPRGRISSRPSRCSTFRASSAGWPQSGTRVTTNRYIY